MMVVVVLTIVTMVVGRSPMVAVAQVVTTIKTVTLLVMIATMMGRLSKR